MSQQTDDLGDALKASWGRFLDVYEPLRPDLYRYCRHLTRSPWDAEDMSQDAMALAYVTLGCMQAPPPNPRAWLFRVASNLWLNRTAMTVAVVGTAATHRIGPSSASSKTWRH
jgi:RNA polymerase sigma-70 factor, ECF subfamily